VPEGPSGPRPHLFGPGERPADGLESIGELIESGAYPREPKSIAEALLRHVDPTSFWTLVASGDIHPILVRPEH
jgi:hypothetical protein